VVRRWLPIATQDLRGNGYVSWRAITDAPMTIEEARRAYDAGTHEMAQRRVGSVMQLVIIERQQKCRPRHYFAARRGEKFDLWLKRETR
jgi:hypothetical protein